MSDPKYKRSNILPFHDLSIQKRLPLLMCFLLLLLVTTFTLVSYYSLRNASLKIGKERLRSVTTQISTMLSQSVQNNMNAGRTLIRKDSVKQFLKGDERLRPAIETMLKKMKKDSTWNAVGLLDTLGRTMIQTNEPVLPFRNGMTHMKNPADSMVYGNIRFVNDTIYYALTAKIRSGNKLLGYLVNWRVMPSNRKGMEQITALMGFKGTIYIGNKDGSAWTDMIKATEHARIDTVKISEFHSYKNTKDEKVIAATEPIPSTTWMVAIEFSEALILESASRFLNTIILIGIIIILIGTFIAWNMSRNIIRPLNQLSKAASSIASGNYSKRVEVTGMDEVGQLGRDFNSMADKVQDAQKGLEQQVADRTSQLQTANREMEAFTYSVSHDLRAPLRAVIGFTTILHEDYGSRLDDEAIRITGVIKSNAIKMGTLIDDLLNFSRLGKKEIVKERFNTNEMLKGIIDDMKCNANIEWELKPLPDSIADMNSLRQVWINLISNAVKYSSKVAHPKIEIGFTGGKINAFYIKDNGVGFDSKYKNKLFKVFQRLHSLNEFEGSGVGLAIIEKVISKHEGSVWAESEINKGATFYFTLPGVNL